VMQEMDYQAEARNGVRFRKMFGKLPDVFIPEMFTELTSRRVLVMQWVEVSPSLTMSFSLAFSVRIPA
jgi:aarF domain-containing kinase